jgi:hypothetical protein
VPEFRDLARDIRPDRLGERLPVHQRGRHGATLSRGRERTVAL